MIHWQTKNLFFLQSEVIESKSYFEKINSLYQCLVYFYDKQ